MASNFAGGIAQLLRDRLQASGFLEAMRRSGRFRSTLERVPIAIVKGDVALLAVASEVLRLLEAEPGPEEGMAPA